ncbi:MAG: MaoC/PaaZ C-terminal domain-containing protein [Acidimicrobiales bacterium]
MPINADAAGAVSEPERVSWDSNDALIYALGVGAGALDPTGSELEFTTENSRGVDQRVLPTFPVVLGRGRGVYRSIGTFDPAMLVHGEQSVLLHRSLPVEGAALSVTTITGIYDKGSGAVVATETCATDETSGGPRWTTASSVGGGGVHGGPSGSVTAPEREPDHRVVYPTRIDQALFYRLSGDRNPLHSDPTFAALAGFDRPILHGLCSFGFTGRALLHSLCGSDPDRFVSMSARFSKPVMPGDELTVSVWELGDGTAYFRTATPAGIVIDAGQATYR